MEKTDLLYPCANWACRYRSTLPFTIFFIFNCARAVVTIVTTTTTTTYLSAFARAMGPQSAPGGMSALH